MRYSNTIMATIEHLPSDSLVVASFNWEHSQPVDTYTIDASPKLSLELDKHLPVRPVRISLTGQADVTDLSKLENIAGLELADSVRVAPFFGFCALKLELSNRNRWTIAELQLHSPSTPPILKRACAAILTGSSFMPNQAA
jgi:hypothetical protein